MGKKAVIDYNVALQLNPADVSSQGLLAEVKKSLISAGETVETIEALEVSRRGGVRSRHIIVDTAARCRVLPQNRVSV